MSVDIETSVDVPGDAATSPRANDDAPVPKSKSVGPGPQSDLGHDSLAKSMPRPRAKSSPRLRPTAIIPDAPPASLGESGIKP